MKQDIEVASRIEREKVIQELHVAYKMHKDPKHYIISSAAIQKYAVPLFKAGAEWQENQSSWISIDEQFPEDKQLVLCSSQIYGKVVLCWDELSQSWSYPESGEFYCDWDKVDCWMLIPEV